METDGLPSWPESLRPQAHTEPSEATASVCPSPPAAVVTVPIEVTEMGTALQTYPFHVWLVVTPSSPSPLTPHAHRFLVPAVTAAGLPWTRTTTATPDDTSTTRKATTSSTLPAGRSIPRRIRRTINAFGDSAPRTLRSARFIVILHL